jgi:hypothetical protein
MAAAAELSLLALDTLEGLVGVVPVPLVYRSQVTLRAAAGRLVMRVLAGLGVAITLMGRLKQAAVAGELQVTSVVTKQELGAGAVLLWGL